MSLYNKRKFETMSKLAHRGGLYTIYKRGEGMTVIYALNINFGCAES